MSELKAIESATAVIENVHLVYIKSEADKVIAELEESNKMEVEQLLIEIAELKKGAKNLILDNYLMNNEIRRHKYKRCLANAETCAWAEDDFEEALEHAWSQTGQEEYERKRDFWKRWKNKWLEIANQFKR